MNFLCSCILTLIMAVTIGVSQADTGNTTPQEPGSDKKTTLKQVPAAKQLPKKVQKEPWPRTFVPSEKITADSVVSFPADI